MSHLSVKISNIVITYEQYRKLKAYAEAHHISIYEVINLLIDSLPQSPKNNKVISKNYPFIFSRRILTSYLKLNKIKISYKKQGYKLIFCRK